MERLAHRPERLFEPRGLGARDPERSAELLGGEPSSRHRTEVTEQRGDVPAAVGEHRADDPPDPGLDLEAGEKGGEGLGTRPAAPFGHREDDGRHRRRPVHDGAQVGVVEVERVTLGAVGERGQQRARPAARPTTVACGRRPRR
jgi:hypothetical protein